MTMLTIENGICFTVTTIIACCITTGLILTFATSGGISAGAIPFTIAACIIMCITIVYGVLKSLEYCGLT